MSGEQPVPAYDPTQGSVGIVQTHYFSFDELRLDSGARLGPVTLAYETYGRLNERRDNAVLVLHALSGDAHVAGWHSPQDRYPGWWDSFVGPGKGLDTDRYFVICSNVIGGCKGSTGPSSIDPRTGRPYAMRFPVVTIGDMVRAQARLIDHLGIERLLAVIGGSMGGMQALQWAVDYPDRVAGLIPIASCMRLSALGIAFNEVGRRAIMIDPAWRDGDYYDGEPPADGLGLARMIGHVTYLSEASMAAKFGRRLRHRDRYGFDFGIDFEVESYLRYQGERFVQRFDANSYLYITKAMDYFDLTRGEMTPAEAMAPVQARTLVVSVTSDWLYPSAQSEEIAEALRVHGKPVQHRIINSDYGHDSFLLETPWLTREVGDFLAELHADLQG